MSDWSSGQYLKFEKQRTQPAIDLANRIKDRNPQNVLDIGCGPGNSSHVLKLTFSNAKVTGIDTSPDMIKKAKSAYPDIEFLQLDARMLKGQYDVLFSNACLQWIPDHRRLLPELMGKLRQGGVFAAQIPMNRSEPLHQIINEISSDPKWGLKTEKADGQGTLQPEEYYNILSECSSSFQLWETTYYHSLENHRALVEWAKGTRIRPYLYQLSLEKAEQFEQELLNRVTEVYQIMNNGKIILRFRRFFFTAVK